MQLIMSLIYHIGLIELASLGLLMTNTLTFCLYAADKRKAVKGRWRISEKVLLFFTIALGGIGALAGMCIAKHKTRKMGFRIAVAIGLAVTLIPVIHIIHGLTLDRMIRYKEIEFCSSNWPAELDGYRIAFISDTHAIDDGEIRKVATELNGRNLDLLILGGDFTMENAHYRGTVRELAQITASDGIYGVEGNHDDYMKVFEAFEQYGITPLDNSGVRIRDSLYLAGISDFWNRAPSIQEAVAGAGAEDFTLLVSHNADASMMQPTGGIDLILSGHTHGGQITFFGYPFYLLRIGGLPITEYGTRFAYGFARSADSVPVYVTRGIGTFSYMPRVFSRPEVVIFKMFCEG